MSMVVQHNLQAMNSNRMLGITTGAQSKSTEKLSSGYKINRAADDAAGLTISEKMRKQIRGLDRASTNAQDGVSAVQTAEGALTEVHSMLQRMNELATQAANGTNSESDRKAIQDELDQLITEIDRVAETTKFNEIYLLKGDKTGEKKDETIAAHDAGLAGMLVANQDGTSTFTPESLEDGTKINIAGKNYVISTSTGVDDTTPLSKVKDSIKQALDAGAAGDSITVTPKDGTAATYNYEAGKDGKSVDEANKEIKAAMGTGAAGDTIKVTDAAGTATTYTYKEFDKEADVKAAIAKAAAGKGADDSAVTLANNDTVKLTDASGATTYTYLDASQVKTEAAGGTAITTDAGTNNSATKTITIEHAGGTTDTYTCASNGGSFVNAGGDDVTAAALSAGDKVTLTDGSVFYVQDSAGFYNLSTGDELDPGAAIENGTKVDITIAAITVGSAADFGAMEVGKEGWYDNTTLAAEIKAEAGGKVDIKGAGDEDIALAAGFYDADGKNVKDAKLTPETQVDLSIADTDKYTGKASYTVAANTDENIISIDDAVEEIKKALQQASSIGVDDPDSVTVEYNDGAFTINQGTASVAKRLSFNLHVGADADMTNKISVDIETMNSSYLGIKDLIVVPKDDDGNIVEDGGIAATYAIDAIADAISKVSTQRSALGAVQNRLEHTISNLDNVVENTTAAESRIRDTDMAKEMVEYSKNNILAQAGQSMLAQANQSTQGVLSLLG